MTLWLPGAAILALAAQDPGAGARGTLEPPRFGAPRAEIHGLFEPLAAAIDPQGRIWVVEPYASALAVFESSGKPFASVPVTNVEGRAREPRGIAISAAGLVFVSDAFDDEVLVYDSATGTRVRRFGRRGAAPGEMREPGGLAHAARDGGRLYVADTLNHRVDVFDDAGTPIRSFGARGAGDGELDHPLDVAVDSEGACYVADLGNQRIVKFDGAGRFVTSWGGFGPFAGLFQAPTGVEVFADEVYVADRDNHRIQVFDRDGKPVHEWGEHALRPREAGGKLHYPNEIAVAPDGAFAIVVEGFEDRLQLFGPRDRNHAPPPPQETSSSAHYAGGCSVVNTLFAVVEPEGPTVALFDLRLDVPAEIGRFGRQGSKPGQFQRPSDVLFDASGTNLFVSDPIASRVSMFHVAYEKGEPLRFDPYRATFVRSIDFRALSIEPATPWPVEPAGLALGPRGELYVTDLANGRVVVLDADWDHARTIGRFGDQGGEMRRPTSVAVARDGRRVFVLDARRACVQAFDQDGKFLTPVQPGGTLAAAREFVRLSGRPSHVALGIDDSFLVTNETFADVQKFSAVSGSLLASFGTETVLPAVGVARPARLGRGQLAKPEGLAVDDAGRIFVVDHQNHRFQVLWGDGRYDTMWGARLFTEAARSKP